MLIITPLFLLLFCCGCFCLLSVHYVPAKILYLPGPSPIMLYCLLKWDRDTCGVQIL